MTGANAEHFWKEINFCLSQEFTKRQAAVMQKGFDKRGMVDASAGCTHYILRLTAEGIR